MAERSKSRTTLLRKNILASFVVKGWSGLVQLMLVPATLLCLGAYENGLWMTIYSFLFWIESLDIGLGNGLRNKLAAYLAHDEQAKARQCVSSTLVMLIAVIVPIGIAALCAIAWLDPYTLLNIDTARVPHLREVLLLSTSLICCVFVVKFIGNIYLALQLPAINNALVVGGQTLALLFVVLLNMLHPGGDMLLWVALAYTLSPLIVYAAAFPITFRRYPTLRPSLRSFSWPVVGEMFRIGIRFFVLQIAGIILFTTSNALISRMFSPSMVTPYQVAYRYFSLAMMLFTIVAVPFWSATTEAFERGDVAWIRRSMRRMHLVLVGIALLLVCMTALAQPVYRLWVGADVVVPLRMSVLMAAYMMIVIFSLSYSYFLNGLNALSLQLLFTVGAALVYIPLAWHWGKVFGVEGMLLALCVVNIPGAVVNSIQFHKIVNGKANGLWRPTPTNSSR